MHKVIDGAAWIEGISNVNERGRYFMMLGGYWTDNGDLGSGLALLRQGDGTAAAHGIH